MTDFYAHGSYPAAGASGSSASMRAELDSIAAGFAKLYGYTGNGNKIVKVNGTGTGYTGSIISDDGSTVTVAGAMTVTGQATVTDSLFSVKDNADATKVAKFEASGITTGTTRTYTFPDATTTFVGTDTTQELTNKTLNASVAKGTWTASGTWTLPAITLGGAVSSTGNPSLNIGTGALTAGSGTFLGTLKTSSADFTVDTTVWSSNYPKLVQGSGTYYAVHQFQGHLTPGDSVGLGAVTFLNKGSGVTSSEAVTLLASQNGTSATAPGGKLLIQCRTDGAGVATIGTFSSTGLSLGSLALTAGSGTFSGAGEVATFGANASTGNAATYWRTDAGLGLVSISRNAGAYFDASAAGDFNVGNATGKSIRFGNTSTGATRATISDTGLSLGSLALTAGSGTFSGEITRNSTTTGGITISTVGTNSVHPTLYLKANNRYWWNAAIDTGTDATWQLGTGAAVGANTVLTTSNTGLSVNGTGTFSKTLQITGQQNPSSGVGGEMFYDTSGQITYILSYDRGSTAYKQMNLGASSYSIGVNGTQVLGISSTGLSVTGSLSATTDLLLQRSSGSSLMKTMRFVNSTTNPLTSAAQGDILAIGNAGGTSLYLCTNDTVQATLDSSGNLGVGAAASGRKLEVTGSGTNQIFGFNTAAPTSAIYSCTANQTMVAGENAAASVMFLRKDNGTSRSINAAGTINASGADYAEYERNNGLTITKGAVVGFKADGTLTLTFSEAVRFGIKSTNPSYVGGDTWGSEDVVGKRPEKSESQTDEEFAPILAAWEAKLEAERQKVDRIAYSGKVPVNVQGATPGGYIVAKNDNGAISGEFVQDPDFAQYKLAVGRVNRVLDDGRAEVAVMVH